MNIGRIARAGVALSFLALPAVAQQDAAADAPGNNLANPEAETQQEAVNRSNAAQWDADGDGTITGEEFMNEWEKRDIFAQWDENGDGNVTSEELGRGFLSYYDTDGSEMLEEYEHDEFGTGMATDGFFGR
ncbi:EF-hand domain-containing protein [Roseitranquillus sediminis]|uniref:hypothetical protein n=1 Tax=Roseitranquillus sediminis TaxID=2809051 RepID=UPI001D0C4720|nr:hypothetical protein [Roseitranquillus sediminis]MBM9595493.1 hypothetical protein [Roseitranquillus sediminis]